MDADFSHDPHDLERLREACLDGAGVAVGSRYTAGRRVQLALAPHRHELWRIAVCQHGPRLGGEGPHRRIQVLPRRDPAHHRLDHIHFVGYAFQIEMKYNARKLGFPIAEVPITFIDRELGTSKMSLNIFREAFLGVLQMRRFDIQPANPGHMTHLFTGATLVHEGRVETADLLIQDDRILAVDPNCAAAPTPPSPRPP